MMTAAGSFATERNARPFHVPDVKIEGPYKDTVVVGYRGGRYLGRICRVEVTCPKLQKAPWIWPEYQSTYMNCVHVVYADSEGKELEYDGGIYSDDFTVIDVMIERLSLRTGNYGDIGELGFYFDFMGHAQAAFAELVADAEGHLWLIITPEEADIQD